MLSPKELSAKFDEIMNSFSDEYLMSWYKADKVTEQFNRLKAGETIIMDSLVPNTPVNNFNNPKLPTTIQISAGTSNYGLAA